ncbi:MAG: SpoIIE family protein phosphatase [Candidatus Rifleibacteriota bacterium]
MPAIIPALVVFPLFFFLIYLGLYNIEQQHFENELRLFSQESSGLLDRTNHFSDSEEFWCRTLNKDFDDVNGDYQAFYNMLLEYMAASGEDFPCLIWSEDGKLFVNTHFKASEFTEHQAKLFLENLKELEKVGKKKAQSQINFLRQFLGPQLVAGRVISAMNFGCNRFIRPDSAGKRPEFWLKIGEKFTAMVFFDRSKIDTNSGLRVFSNKNSTGDKKILLIDNREKASSSLGRLARFVENLERDGLLAGISDNLLISGRRISGGITLAVIRKYHFLLQPEKMTLLLVIISLFLLLTVLRSLPGRVGIESLSVKWQLLLMLFVTTGLPLLTMAIVLSDHVVRKRAVLIKSAYQSCISFLQHVDERSLVNHADIMHRTDQAIDDLRKILPEKFGKPKVVSVIRNRLKRMHQDIRIISSSPAILMTEFGVLDSGHFLAFKDNKKPESKTMLEVKMFLDIASYFLSVINNRPVGLEKFSETELFAEMVYQRPFHEIIQNMMLAKDTIIPMGWGEKPYPFLLKLVSLRKDRIVDYFFAVLFNSTVVHREFMIRQIDNLERNPLDLKFTFTSAWFYSKNFVRIEDDPWFKKIFEKTGRHPALEPCFTTIDGKEHVYAGMNAQNLDSMYLFAFYPIDKIDRQIDEEKKFLFAAGFVGILLLIGIALVFSSSFVLPLGSLQAGALAIRNRDFSFRLLGLSDDEFGRMARVFNSSIADFEELSLAGIVQSRLLPGDGIVVEGMSLYGRSIPMAELGGDYFDYFALDQENYVILAGDVAGHGVGASLIMAMAKAGIMQCRDFLNDPAKVLQRLHRMILETRTRAQRKVMTFQYLYFNRLTGSAVYSNAGACSPMLVDKVDGKVDEIKLGAPVLGGFKNSVFSNLDLKLAQGQALVFYTDGIIETTNSDGLEIGYERFKEILLDSFDDDPKMFYQNIYCRYMNWLGDRPAQDDLTIIILVRT